MEKCRTTFGATLIIIAKAAEMSDVAAHAKGQRATRSAGGIAVEDHDHDASAWALKYRGQAEMFRKSARTEATTIR